VFRLLPSRLATCQEWHGILPVTRKSRLISPPLITAEVAAHTALIANEIPQVIRHLVVRYPI
jgi:hypothetical protein